ncbi:hypothetical protein [Dorea formicigenerans]|uniref:hypothetical protein n=1 Tax=Dorea formicigenerans TaxID=39486 RepID=UPI0015FB1E4B|nr:hypothetical protein [Dorea formicigenerans]
MSYIKREKCTLRRALFLIAMHVVKGLMDFLVCVSGERLGDVRHLRTRRNRITGL